jgi:serine/threonine protein kinase
VQKLRRPIGLETTFDSYELTEVLGEGGAGRVYGGTRSDGRKVAIKVLSGDRATADRKKRFKNEIKFLSRNTHKNIVNMADHGVAHAGKLDGPFFVMDRYDTNLRRLMAAGIPKQEILPLFIQILDGIEAAHLQNVVHRDIKPENILYNTQNRRPAIADFGIASFTDDVVATLVETSPTQRLANFQYAAPEQRTTGKLIDASADIYALGSILNEMFTGAVPHGTGYRTIGSVAKEFGFLDPIVDRMIKQNPSERPQSIGDLKGLLEQHQAEVIARQRLNEISNTVVPADEIDEPLANKAPRLISFDWDEGKLTLILDRHVSQEWIAALHNLGSFTSLLGKEPSSFMFRGDRAYVSARPDQVQPLINHFKSWLPLASGALKESMERKVRQAQERKTAELQRRRKAEEERLRLLSDVKI